MIPGQELVRIKLLERPGINIYTSVEIIRADGSRFSLRESARGHASLAKAEERIEQLLGSGPGGWRQWVSKETRNF